MVSFHVSQTVFFLHCTQGWASLTLPPLGSPAPETGMGPLLDVILDHVPPPRVSVEEPFSMCVAMIERDPFVGRIATGVTPDCAWSYAGVQGDCL